MKHYESLRKAMELAYIISGISIIQMQKKRFQYEPHDFYRNSYSHDGRDSKLTKIGLSTKKFPFSKKGNLKINY